jgi:tetratricopeptide (TPR) repeat protein
MEALRQLQTELGPKNLLVLGINQREEAGPIRAFAKAHQGEYALLPDDGAVSKLYEVNGVPDTYLIDWRGVVRRRLQGWGPVFEKELRKTVERLLNEQRPAPKEEPPPAKEEAPAAPSKGEPDKIPPELRAYAHLQLAAAYINIGDAFTRSGLEDDGNYDRAIKELTAGLAIDPKNVDLTAWLGVACERKGDRPRAIEYYRATLRLDPKHTYAQQALNRLGAPGPTEPETR